MMNAGPPPPDPNATTQSIPIVTPPPRAPRGPGGGYGAVRPPGPYVHRFGNVPAYLLGRLAAFLVDVPGVAFVLATFGFNSLSIGPLLIVGHDRAGFESLAAIALGLALALAFLCEALFGTTLGKLVFGLHTRGRDGRHAGVGRVFVRHLLRPVDALAVGPLLAVATPRHQRLGDFAGGTVVGLSPLRAGAPLLGILLCAGIGYAQFAYGGGLTSVLGVAAETAAYGPDVATQAAAVVGLVVPGLAAAPTASPRPKATEEATPAATPEASAEPNAATGPQPEDSANAETADPTDTPDASDTPEPQSSPNVIVQ